MGLGIALAACAPVGDGAAGDNSEDDFGANTAAISPSGGNRSSTDRTRGNGGGRGGGRGTSASTSTAPRLAFVSNRTGNLDIFVMRSDGTGLRQLTRDPEADMAPAWTPDGSRVVFASTRGGMRALWVHELATGAETLLATGLAVATAPRVSPDGTRVAFEGADSSTGLPDIYTVPIAGGTPTRLTTDPASDSVPVWSADGARIYFLSDRGGAWEIYAMGADGSGARAVTTGSRILGRFDLARDERSAVFAQLGPSQTFPIVRRDLTTGADTPLTPDLESEPAVSPAGDRLAVTTTRYGSFNPDIVLFDLVGGTAPVRLTTEAGFDMQPVWDPSGL